MSDHMPSVPVCPHCGTAVPELATKLDRLEAECTRLHREKSHLKAELTKVTGSGSDEKLIAELHDEWLAPRAARRGRKPKLTDDRRSAYRKLLKDFGAEDALKVVKQSAKTPYLVFGRYQGAPGTAGDRDRRDDITEITAKAARVEQLLSMCDGDDGMPAAAPQDPEPGAGAPRAHLLHGPLQGWTPINRATTALKREAGWDTCQIEWSETTLLNDGWPKIVQYHAWCPLHQTFVGLKLREDAIDGRVRAECEGACAEKDIVRAIFDLEEKQVRRVEALLAFDRTASPQTLDKVVKALEIRANDSRYKIGRKMGIHDDEALGLIDTTTVELAA